MLGPNVDHGEVLQYVVPKGTIFASSVPHSEGYSLVGCMCQPAFEFKYFELFTQDELTEVYPQYRRMIQKYALKNIEY